MADGLLGQIDFLTHAGQRAQGEERIMGMGMIAQAMPLSKDFREQIRVVCGFLSDNKEGSWNLILPEKGKEVRGGSGIRAVVKGQDDCMAVRRTPAENGHKEAHLIDKRGYAAGNQEYTQGNSGQ